jgi:hypothetical protein
MSIYSYQNTDTKEIVDVFQGMNDEHIYLGENGKEKNWVRLFCLPNLATEGLQSSIDPNSKNDFKRYTSQRQGKIGEVMDLSAELSERRKEKYGIDPVKQKFYDDYSKIRHGKKHPQEAKENKISKNGFSVSFED